MQNSNFLQTNGVFILNTLKCLRSEYLYNDCRLCFGMCEKEAVGLFRNKIVLNTADCLSCGECIGVCPTEALTLQTFDSVDFVLKVCAAAKNKIIDKVDVPSLAVFDENHFISIVLRTKKDLTLVCENENILQYLEEKIDISNRFLTEIGISQKVTLQTHQTKIKEQRRNILKIFNNLKNEVSKEEKATQKLNQAQKLVPAKKILLKNSLKTMDFDFETLEIQTTNFINNRNISYDKCTNCGDCITFCPTEALFCSSAKDGIYFQSGKCIGCNICEAVCKEEAISKSKSLKLFNFAFDRPISLVSFRYEVCMECKTSFVYKEGKQICTRCAQFADDFKDMFVMAKDIVIL